LLDLLASYNVPAQITAIEDMIASGAEMQLVLRLLCLASITSGGIKLKALENIKREILQVCFIKRLTDVADTDTLDIRLQFLAFTALAFLSTALGATSESIAAPISCTEVPVQCSPEISSPADR
jgi:hypothetical protein